MIFDTDIFIWVQRGNEKASKMIERSSEKFHSIQTYMDLLQCAKNKTQHRYTKDFLISFDFMVQPITENIGHRALIYIEEYSFSSNLRAGDAIIAAKAIENNLPLVSGDAKHFKPIKDLAFKVFKP